MSLSEVMKKSSVGMRPVMVLEITDAEGNPYGFDRIEVLMFNFDGRGSALVRQYSKGVEGGSLGSYNLEDIETLLIGDAVEGTVFYHEVDLPS